MKLLKKLGILTLVASLVGCQGKVLFHSIPFQKWSCSVDGPGSALIEHLELDFRGFMYGQPKVFKEIVCMVGSGCNNLSIVGVFTETTFKATQFTNEIKYKSSYSTLDFYDVEVDVDGDGVAELLGNINCTALY